VSGGGRSTGGKSRSRAKSEAPPPDSPDDDRLVWGHVARQVMPARLKPRVPTRVGVAGDAERRLLLRLGSRAAAGLEAREAAPEPRPRTEGRRSERTSPPLADFDRRTARRIGSGQIEIDARLDLHGLRQREAHAALLRFLRSAQARGDRIVLVITGKGAAGARDGDDDRGVLKRNVPRWLAEAALRAIVVSHTTAHARHGGEGALYVRIRAA